MLYLEDFLEMIEHLPSELQDRFSDIRDIDRSIEGRLENLESRQKSFFASCRKTRVADREEEFQRIREEYKKLIVESQEKCSISDECYNLVDRYLRKLDQELHDFKMELEADNRGITEMLERHSLELDQPLENNHKENRMPKKGIRKHHNSQNHSSGIYVSENGGFMLNDDLSVESLSPSSPSNAFGHMVSAPSFSGPSHFGANPIAAAATQAIAATQQLTGRRTSSLKATYEAIHLGVEAHEFSVGRDSLGMGDGASDGSIPTAVGLQGPRKKKRKNPSSATSNHSLGIDGVGPNDLIMGVNDDLASGREGPPDGEWFDPSEPRYCLCNQVSYGEMVGCDNPTCPAEWFHYACVGVTQPPRGKWYCPTCSGTMTKKKGRK